MQVVEQKRKKRARIQFTETAKTSKGIFILVVFKDRGVLCVYRQMNETAENTRGDN